MRKTTAAFFLAIVAFLPGVVMCDEGAGGYAGSFLEVPIGARPAAMGGAYLAVSDDGAGPLYNPAGPANLKKKLFTSSYRTMKLDRTLGYVSVIFPTKGNSILGVSWLYAGSGSVDGRNSLGQLTGHDVSFDSHDFAVVFAKRFEDFLSVGLKINYYQANFTQISAGSVGLDFGLMFYVEQLFDREVRDQLAVRNIQAGLVVKNIGSRFVWNNSNYIHRFRGADLPGSEQQDEIPLEVGIGGSARFLDRRLTLAVDLLKNEESDARFHAGAEYLYSRKFAIRGGYSDGRMTAGTGYLFDIGKSTLAIDYAFSTDKADEGDEHIFSFDLLF